MTAFGANHAKGAIAAEPHSDEDLQKYARRLEFDPTVLLEEPFTGCSSSRIKIGDDDPLDFYITAAHCISEQLRISPKELQTVFDNQGVNVFIHPKIDLAIFTTGEHTNHPKYPLYAGNLNSLVGKTLTSVGYGMSMLDSKNSNKRQAFDTIISTIEPVESVDINTQFNFDSVKSVKPLSIWNWIWNRDKFLLNSDYFKSDLNKMTKNNPMGMSTPGYSGGSLLVKEKDGYKLVGVTQASTHKGWDMPNSDWNTRWTAINLGFVESAKKELLTKSAVYAYPAEPKAGSPTLTFLLSNKNSFNQQYLWETFLFWRTNEKYFIGYASQDAELIVLIDGEEFFNIPFKVGATNLIYQIGQSHYAIKVTVDQASDGNKGFLVKGIALNEEKDTCAAPSLTDELMMGNNEDCNTISCNAKIQPIYYSFSKLDLPLEVFLYSYLPNKNFIDTNLSENKDILGYYAGDSYGYNIAIKLNDQELKTLKSKEIADHTKSFEFYYAGNTYRLYFRKSKGYKDNRISLWVEMLSKNLLYDSIESMTATGENFIPVYINPYQYGKANSPSESLFRIRLVKGAEIKDGGSNKTTDYAKKGSQIELTISDRLADRIDNHPVKSWSIDKEGCHYITYRAHRRLYVIEVNIQKFNDLEEHYKVGLKVKSEIVFDEELFPAVLANLANESCESETAGNLIEYSLTDASKVIASDLNLTVKPIAKIYLHQSPLPEGCIGYGKKGTAIRIFFDSTFVKEFSLGSYGDNFSKEFEKNGKSYSINCKTVFERDRWRIVVDIHEIQEKDIL